MADSRGVPFDHPSLPTQQHPVGAVRPVRPVRPAGLGAGSSGDDTSTAAVTRATLRPEHLHVESRLRLPESIGGPADYERLLELWSTVWAAVADQRDDTSAPGRELIALAERAGELLAADRSALASRPAPPAPSPAAPVRFVVSPDAAARWGTAYVLKGSSLGNRVLRPLIGSRLDGVPPTAFGYLTGRGSEVRRDWRRFCARLDRWGAQASADDVQRMIAAGAATFRLVADAADAVAWPETAGRAVVGGTP